MKAAHKETAAEIVDSIGAGASFDDVKERLAGKLAEVYEDGQKSLEGVDATQLDLRQTTALESIADHLGAVRANLLGETMDTDKARDVLKRCGDVLRFPRRTVDAQLMEDIRGLLNGPD